METPPLETLVQGYDELRRRDTQAEYSAWIWRLWGLCGWLACVVLLGLVVWLTTQRNSLHAFVQPVQVSESGSVQPLGLPVDLLAYTPQEAQYLEMVGQWIRYVRWHGTDTTLAQHQWQWAGDHTCKSAQSMLSSLEKALQPTAPGPLRRVELKAITTTPAPRSYQAIWEESGVGADNQPYSDTWTGTFTVGRLKPTTERHMLNNRLGLCITAFDMSKQP